jgi:hypothetical protein
VTRKSETAAIFRRHDSNSHRQAKVRLQSAFPIQHAFAQRVDIPNHKDGNETKHAPENHRVAMNRFAKNYRPGVHEYDLEIEKDEEHRDEVKLYAESRLCFTNRHHSAFVSRIFDAGTTAGFTQQYADDQR